MNSEENELALSNSQLKYHNLNPPPIEPKNFESESSKLNNYSVKFGYLGSFIDRLTIVGNLTGGLRDLLMNDFRTDLHILNSDCFRGQLFRGAIENFFIEYDLEKSRKMGIRSFRLEFNPRLSRKEQLEYVFNIIVPKLENMSISRIDIAFDFERDLSAFVIDKAISKRIFYGKDNKIETIYYGSPTSEYQLRIYDKYKERKKKGTDYEKLYYGSYDCYWRLEFQLNGSKYIEKQVRQNFHVLQETKITKRNYAIQDLSIQEQIFLYAKDNVPNLFSQLGKTSKSKYSKIANDISEIDLSDAFRDAIAEIEYCYDFPIKVSLVDFCKRIID